MKIISIVGENDAGKTTFCNNLEKWVIVQKNGNCHFRVWRSGFGSIQTKSPVKRLKNITGMGPEDFRGIYRVNINNRTITIGISSPGDGYPVIVTGLNDFARVGMELDYLFLTAHPTGEYQYWRDYIQGKPDEANYLRIYKGKSDLKGKQLTNSDAHFLKRVINRVFS